MKGKNINTLLKSLIFTGFFILAPLHALADSFPNFPSDSNPCNLSLYNEEISDGYNGTRLCKNQDGVLSYWDNVGNYHSNQWYLTIATSSVTLTNRYLFLVTQSLGGIQPNCPTYAQDTSGATVGTNMDYFGSPLNAYEADGSYGYYDGTASVFYTFCRYDLGTAGQTVSGLKFSTATSSYACFAGTCGFNGGKIYAVYTNASSTSFSTELNTVTKFATFQSFIDSSTHIISFAPDDGATLSASSSVPFSLYVYINPTDVDGASVGVRVKLHNINQNALISAITSSDIVLYDHIVNTGGYLSFATSTPLPAGNYRVEASLDKSLAYGYLRNPFSSLNATVSHSFIVGQATFIGNISNNMFKQGQAIFGTYQATSTEVMAHYCNVLSGFDTMGCLGFLFIPDSKQLSDSMLSFRDGVLQKFPWGYVTRTYAIFQTTATGTLPSLTVDIPMPFDNQTFTMDMGGLLITAGNNLNNITSPIHHKTVRDILEPIAGLMVALAVLFTIVLDLTGMHDHPAEMGSGGGTGGGSKQASERITALRKSVGIKT